MRIGNFRVDENSNRVFIIAEVGHAHEGRLQDAKLLAQVAAEAAADAIKFQKLKAEEVLVPSHPEYSLFKSYEMQDSEWEELVSYSRGLGLIVMADVFDFESAELMNRLGTDAFKIHSSDVPNVSLIQHVARFGKPMLLSASAATLYEIANAIRVIKEERNRNLALMFGFQAFPTRLEDSKIRWIPLLRRIFKLPVGYADHCDAELPMAKILPSMAIAAGARIIEKHITIDRSRKGEDYESALSAREFAGFVRIIRENELSLGPKEWHQSSDEIHYAHRMKKRMVAKCAVSKGTKLQSCHLAYKRFDSDTFVLEESQVLGKPTKVTISENEEITLSKLDIKVGILVAVRFASTRLPGKTLVDIQGQSALAHLLDRLKLAKLPRSIVVCTTNLPEDAEIVSVAEAKGVEWFRGSESNVLDRFIKAAEMFSMDVIVRVTGDDILSDPYYIDKAVELHLAKNAEYTKVDGLPYGVGREVISLSALKKAYRSIKEPIYYEYLTWFLDNEEFFYIAELLAEEKVRRPTYRLTLDYLEDLTVFNIIFKHFRNRGSQFTLEEVVEFLDTHPEVVRINAGIEVKPERPKAKPNFRIRSIEL